jgi:hypothetical protein
MGAVKGNMPVEAVCDTPDITAVFVFISAANFLSFFKAAAIFAVQHRHEAGRRQRMQKRHPKVPFTSSKSESNSDGS